MAQRPDKADKATPSAQPTTSGRYTPKASGRYTPPIPKEYKVSPTWVPVLMGVFLVTGMLLIILNYLEVLPEIGGNEASNWYLLGGLGLITAGFITATKWR